EGSYRAEASPLGHPFDGQAGGFKQGLRATDARSDQPLERCRVELGLEASIQGTNAHCSSTSDHIESEGVIVQILFEPGEDTAQGCVLLWQRWVLDELGLATVAFQRHHGQPRS